MASGDHLIVAAVDFGTTFSGYAFSFLHEYQKDPTKCSTFTWTAGSGGLQSLKTSSCVLFDKHGNFHSCGFEAEDKYSELALDEEHHDWMFFKRFKMNLYKQIGIRRDFKLEADNGKQMDAMKVFSKVIEYLKDHLVEKCKSQQTSLDVGDIMFVITVPAIWTDPAKQFMREAAEMAGIDKDDLVIALEPEAASLFCKHVPIEKMTGSSGKGFNVFSPGSAYIVLDAGGGTIDITVHQVQQNGTLKEIHKANGGDWGGTKVDEAFRELLEDIVGKKVMEKFCKDYKYDMLELFRNFEVKKRTITPDLDEKITFKVPISLNETFKAANKCDIKDTLKRNPKYKDQINWMGDKLRMSANIAKGLFSNSVSHIVEHLKNLAQIPEVSKATYILMVGGYSESPMLRDAVMVAFKNKKVVVPNEAGLSVLKGAVIFGHEPSTIQCRVSKYTYGIGTSIPFDEHEHDWSRRMETSTGEVLCTGVFHKHVEINQQIEVGIPQAEQTYTVTEPHQTRMTLEVYISKDPNPMYVDEDGDDDSYDSEIDWFNEQEKCIYLGELDIDIPGEGLGRSATAAMTFSGTELKVEAWNEGGEYTEASFDLLE
ncbi:heat shock 70 kDa protein 12A-like [Saccostrea echinata]|uniref:heat shock 70 kDa protein 12A-like n=1 Tax=Saccostrea echinata TaxID=191078 RepID=UPI002A8129EC|nr:heat shock 70 kDa protein 12A-like [Saccostrea echinata]